MLLFARSVVSDSVTPWTAARQAGDRRTRARLRVSSGHSSGETVEQERGRRGWGLQLRLRRPSVAPGLCQLTGILAHFLPALLSLSSDAKPLLGGGCWKRRWGYRAGDPMILPAAGRR